MESKEKEIRQRLKDDFIHYASKCLKIRPKELGSIVPFEVNRAQKFLHSVVENQLIKKGFVRVIIVKGRQQGCSTYIEGRFYWKTTHNFGVRSFILTHEEEATNNLFDMAKRYHDHCPSLVKPTTKTSNSKELVFDGLDSGYKLGTAGNKSVGRSSTNQFLHASEAAFYKHADEHAKGIMQTVPNAHGTEIFIESTANGVGNWFHQQWQQAEAGLSDFIPVFIPWFWQNEYRRNAPEDFIMEEEEIELKNLYNLDDNQVVWRRYKIVELSVNGSNGYKNFKQEYPCNSTEAFQLSGEDTYINPEIVATARKCVVERYGKLILGVDIARFGDDSSVIIRRQGRVAFGLEAYVKKDNMEMAGIIHKIIVNENPYKIFIDVGGGAGVIDRLIELGHKDIVVGVNSGSSPLDAERYLNKRSEMWAEGLKWLKDYPCQIPDDDGLHSDLCGTKYTLDSKSRLVMEKKETMKKRGIRSPDRADALLLTFAYPLTAYFKDEENKNKIAARIMSNHNQLNLIRKNRKC